MDSLKSIIDILDSKSLKGGQDEYTEDVPGGCMEGFLDESTDDVQDETMEGFRDDYMTGFQGDRRMGVQDEYRYESPCFANIRGRETDCG